jgi:hypothetical protein
MFTFRDLTPSLVALAALILVACGGGSGPAGAATVAVEIRPPSASVAARASTQFSSAVTGTVDTTVAWQVVEAGGGTVSASGLYTAPATAGTDHVRVSTRASPTVQATATVTVTSTPTGGGGTEYHVGPNQPYAKIGDVPWYALSPGSTVYIHWRADPYREKFLVSTAGTASAWIRVLGVPGPNGERPVISGNGATTSKNMHFRWSDPGLVESAGLVHVAPHAGDAASIPAYVEIAGLQLQDADQAYTYTAENGTTVRFNDFAACINVRAAKHVLIRDNVITHCGLGVFNWTGNDGNVWYDSLQADTVIRGNDFSDNGVPGSYLEHQVYTESDGVIIEENRFRPQRSGGNGSQIKDRSAGTVIRYNRIESSNGWFIDLVEPENSWDTLGSRSTYKQAFVYGNVIINDGGSQNLVHWNEDHGMSHGRAIQPGGKLFFYHNTVLTLLNAEYWPTPIFNVTSGAYECEAGPFSGRIDVRNNVFALLPASSGGTPNTYDFGYCGLENLDLGVNWVSPGWGLWRSGAANATGTASLLSPAGNVPGFVSVSARDLHLAAGSSALGVGGPLAPEVTSNLLGLDLTPTRQYAADLKGEPRAKSGAGSDLGAYQR